MDLSLGFLYEPTKYMVGHEPAGSSLVTNGSFRHVYCHGAFAVVCPCSLACKLGGTSADCFYRLDVGTKRMGS